LATKTIIGGAPVTQAFADQIGADGFSSDAPGAVKLVKQFIA
jgi:5-methyltetrahydrofolate--homocysteine methyltransferase